MDFSEFAPSDKELIVGFLKPFCNNKPMAMNIIFEINLYDFTPDELAGRYSKLNSKEWFFFTPRKKPYPKSKQTCLITKIGKWQTTGSVRDITVDGKVIGKKRYLVYYIGNQKTNWMMHEYIYNHDKDTKFDKVLCKIHLSPGRKRKTDKKKEEEEDVGEAVLKLFDLDEEEQEQNLQKLPLSPSLDTDKDQEREEEEDVGEEVLKLLDLDEEQLHQPQEQEQLLFNPTLDSNQEQDQEQRNILCSFHRMKSNTFDAQQLPDLYDVRRQELLRQQQQQQQSDVLYMQQQQQQKLIREDEEDREQLQALLRDPVPDANYFIF